MVIRTATIPRKRFLFRWSVPGFALRTVGVLVAISLTAFVMAACGGTTKSNNKAADGATVRSSASTTPSEGPPITWDKYNPFGDSVPTPNLAAAENRLGFGAPSPAALIARLGVPEAIYTHSIDTPADDQALGLVYNHASYGRFVLTEQMTMFTQADLESQVAQCDAAHGCEVTASLVDLDNGVEAELLAGSEVTAIKWLESGGRMFDVFGPAGSLDEDTVKAVANAVIDATA